MTKLKESQYCGWGPYSRNFKIHKKLCLLKTLKLIIKGSISIIFECMRSPHILPKYMEICDKFMRKFHFDP